MRVLDLFSGIGGFSLGLERAGMKTVAFCEIDPYCRAVLQKHWPDVPIYEDVRTLTAARLAADGILQATADAGGGVIRDEPRRRNGARGTDTAITRHDGAAGIDLICGGFPCQDISVAGKGAGIEGERSGLWSEYARIIGEVRPRYVIVENVAALLGRGLARVLGDLASLGYDAEWHCIPASAVGAPHRRDRLWIIGVDHSEHRGLQALRSEGSRDDDPLCGRAEYPRHLQETADAGGYVADAAGPRQSQSSGPGAPLRGRETLELAGLLGEPWPGWLVEPDVGRVAHGIPARVDRLRSLGNAVVPQIPELIGRAILGTAV